MCVCVCMTRTFSKGRFLANGQPVRALHASRLPSISSSLLTRTTIGQSNFMFSSPCPDSLSIPSDTISNMALVFSFQYRRMKLASQPEKEGDRELVLTKDTHINNNTFSLSPFVFETNPSHYLALENFHKCSEKERIA